MSSSTLRTLLERLLSARWRWNSIGRLGVVFFGYSRTQAMLEIIWSILHDGFR